MSILEGPKKINILVLISICLVLGFLLLFGGLKLRAYTGERESIRIVTPSVNVGNNSKASGEPRTGQVVASKTGKKYHLPDCPGAKQISDKNKIIFETRELAEKAGLSPAGNCPGLKLK